ncbi:MAG: hypothetical protein Q4D04_13855, partial [Clostridia bacterium]|nr:hypothetical protein [Clostridia bacterium]
VCGRPSVWPFPMRRPLSAASHAIDIRAGAQCDAPTQTLLILRGLRVFASHLSRGNLSARCGGRLSLALRAACSQERQERTVCQKPIP